MNITRNTTETTLKLNQGELKTLKKAEEIARTISFVRGIDEPTIADGLKSVINLLGDDGTLVVTK